MHSSLLAELGVIALACALTPLLLRLQPARSLGIASARTLRLTSASRPRNAILLCALLAIALRLAALPLLTVPLPVVHDEFSQILLAQTFARGRLTNPTPPLWQHFETFHENMVPTYQSMYPPGQGVFMAIGILLFRHPFWGVVLNSALMCAAITWALQALAPARWALLAGLYTVFRFAIAHYWSDSYFGGAAAALAGALALGGTLRLIRRWRSRDALLSALGLLLLANTRPFEGLCFALPLLIAVAYRLIRPASTHRLGTRPAPAAVTLFATLALGALWMGYYNHRGTGSALLPPYLLNLRTFHLAGPFFGQHPATPPTYRHPEFSPLYENLETANGRATASFPNFLRLTREKFSTYHASLFAPLLLFFLIGFIAALMRRDSSQRSLLPIACIVVPCLASAATIYQPNPHYLAPILVAILAVSIRGARLLLVSARARHRLPLALAFCRAFALAIVIVYATNIVHALRKHEVLSQRWARERQSIEQRLTQPAQQALLLVRYAPSHSPLEEWVYNGPDIPSQQVIWAHAMTPADDAALVRYYRQRSAWIIYVDDRSATITPYTPATPKDDARAHAH